jgi:acyl carrier protein
MEHIGPDSTLERDLGFDSLARSELLTRLEQQLGIQLPDSTLGSIETVADLLGAVAAASPAAPGSTLPEAIHGAHARSPLGTPHHATTLTEVLEWRAAAHPDATHLIVLGDEGEESLSYAQLRDGARVIAGQLLRAGVSRDSTVALMLPTGIGYFHAFFGVLLAGAIPVPIYPPTRPSQLEEHVQRHAEVLANAQVSALITFREARIVARLLKARIPGLQLVLSIDDLQQCSDRADVVATPGPESIAFLQYTSGSTGAPKGVVLTHANLLANIRAMGKVVNASAEDVFVSWLPLYHDMGLIGAWLGSLYFGCLLVCMPPTVFLTRPVRWLRAIHTYRGTLSASPNFGYELCARRLKDEELDGLDLSSWRIAFNGAEPVLPETLERFSGRFGRFGFRPETMTPVFGLAEAAVGLTFPPAGRGPKVDCVNRERMTGDGLAEPSARLTEGLRFVSCGAPLPGYQLRIVDPADSELPERHEGNVQFTGPSATAGYYRNNSATARLLHGEWRDTGDRGYVADGELFITGRAKDIIIRRGRHIYPQEIEQAVGELEGVRKGCVAAFGTHEPTTATEKLVVLAETRGRDPEESAQLRARINQRVIDCIGEPPEEILLAAPHTVLKTSSGKLRRAATRAAYEQGTLGLASGSATTQLLRLVLGSAAGEVRRRVQSAARVAYGLYAWCAALVLAIPLALLVLVLPQAPAWRLTHRAARWLIRAWRIPFSVSSAVSIDPARTHIVIANHCSYLDSVFIAALLPDPHRFVAKSELKQVPVLRSCLRRLGTLFIERFAPMQSVAEVGRLEGEIARGHPLVVFPEGTFTRAPGLQPFHLGAFQVAVASGAAIVPITVRGTRSVLRDGQWLPRRLPVTVTVGHPLEPAPTADTFTAAVRLRDAARAEILRHCGEPDLA